MTRFGWSSSFKKDMILITKIFRFEMAHAVYGYPGKCSHLHGHSYQLDVTVSPQDIVDQYLPAPGFVMDFKDLKQLVQQEVIGQLDHALVLSEEFLKSQPAFANAPNLVTWSYEPTAENILLYAKNKIDDKLPEGIQLVKLKLFETSDSYAEWIKSFPMPEVY